MSATMRFSKLRNRADRGYTLIVGLLLLVVLTLFAIGMFRSFGLQEKIAANTRDKQRALEAAQSALQYGEWWLGQGNGSTGIACSGVNNGNTLANMRVCNTALATPSTLPWGVGSTYLPPSMTANGGGGMAGASSPAGDINYAGVPGLYINYIGMSPNGLSQLFQVTAYGFGGDATTAAVVQSTYRISSGAKDLGQQ
ncbi:pilus assembly PilX family protein [Ralstonia pickettii]|uniref:pilus assembly PilX family protein n=1 Tax=Ralstonia pickettii TaxID=329 RepID=UPI000818B792|nr:PilX N-terminal domain-containing pilus assembly protein [Ralstonia pickettii]NWK43866.1 pilus assembly protein PilX [Ralstonia pickettii]OCS47159.1 pilus assembly protein PilX [Ralstonia pickettii]